MDKILQTEPLPERLLTAVEVAKVLNISRAFAYQLMKRGKIRTVSSKAPGACVPMTCAASSKPICTSE